MRIPKEVDASKKPIFCKDCGSRGSWQRHPNKDHYFESGGLFQECYRCDECGSLTWRLPSGYSFG